MVIELLNEQEDTEDTSELQLPAHTDLPNMSNDMSELQAVGQAGDRMVQHSLIELRAEKEAMKKQLSELQAEKEAVEKKVSELEAEKQAAEKHSRESIMQHDTSGLQADKEAADKKVGELQAENEVLERMIQQSTCELHAQELD